jgi:hypothetical protein
VSKSIKQWQLMPSGDVAVRGVMEGWQPGWDLEVDVGTREGSAGVLELRVRPADGRPSPTTAHVLRELRMSWIYDDIERLVKESTLRHLLPPDLVRLFDRPRPGRRGHGDGWYADRAGEYVRAFHDHDERAPVKWLVEHNPGTTAAQWRAWMKAAENRQLLAGRPDDPHLTKRGQSLATERSD